jgi:hypothetical protein
MSVALKDNRDYDGKVAFTRWGIHGETQVNVWIT